MNESVSRLGFASACSYLPITPKGMAKQKQMLEQSLAAGFEPAILWSQIKRHRIYALAAEVLSRHDKKEVMGDYYPKLIEAARRVRLQGLNQYAVTQQLQGLLQKANIPCYVLKGSQLALKLYGDAGVRHSKDIDVIVPPALLSSAIKILQANWELQEAPVWIEHPVYSRIAKHMFWDFRLRHIPTGYSLELHWSFEKTSSLKMEKIWWEYWQADTETAVLAEILYLCLHGAGCGWPRMKWLGDIRMCLEHYPTMWQDLIPLAKRLNMGAMLAQTILLLEWLYGVKPDEAAQSLIAQEPQAQELALDALTCMTAPENAVQSMGEVLHTRRYISKLSYRYPLFDRMKERLLFYAVPGKDTANLSWPWLCLPVLPLIRIFSFVRRRMWPL